MWSKIEKDILGLLENSIASQDGNKQALITFLKSLYGLQTAVRTSNASVVELKATSLKNMGLERSLNQAIRFLDEDLGTYLSFTDQMTASIDRVLAKSKFVVGEIDYSESEEGAKIVD